MLSMIATTMTCYRVDEMCYGNVLSVPDETRHKYAQQHLNTELQPVEIILLRVLVSAA